MTWIGEIDWCKSGIRLKGDTKMILVAPEYLQFLTLKVSFF